MSAAVEAELRDTYGLEITRLAGPGRNETAAAIAQFGPVVTEGLEFVRDQGATGVDAGQFSGPTDVTSGPDGTIYVADQLNDRVQAFNATGSFLFEWGEDGDDVGQFNAPVGVATAADGTVFVSEFNAYRVQAFSPAATSCARSEATAPARTSSPATPRACPSRPTARSPSATTPAASWSSPRTERICAPWGRPGAGRVSCSPRAAWTTTPTATSGSPTATTTAWCSCLPRASSCARSPRAPTTAP